MNKIDVIIPLIEKDIDKINIVIDNLRKFLNIKNIFIVTAKKKFSKLSFLSKVKLIDEDKVIPWITLSYIINFFRKKWFSWKRAWWYFQQFLKMYISYNKLIWDYYLIWDSDTILLDKIDFFDWDKMIFYTTNEYHKPYFFTIRKLLNIEKQIKWSFIAEHMIIKKEYMIELIELIQKKAWKNNWVNYILTNISIEYLDWSWFSEFETYWSYVYMKYKKQVILRKAIHKLRWWAFYFSTKFNKYDLFLLKKLWYKMVSFEEWNNWYKIIVFFMKIISYLIHFFFKIFNKKI